MRFFLTSYFFMLSYVMTHLNRNTLRLQSNCVPKHCDDDICFTAVLESVSLDKFIPESPSTSEPGDMSPCRSPSTPRHLRYRQTGGTSPTDTLTTHDRDVLFSSREVSTLLFPLSWDRRTRRGQLSDHHVSGLGVRHRHSGSRTRQLPG